MQESFHQKDHLPKPILSKAYGHIANLPDSRLGRGDHHIHEGQARICCQKTRDIHDLVVVQEKLDGACCCVAKINGAIQPIGRAGYPAELSPHKHIVLFSRWAFSKEKAFRQLLTEGERVVGEWLALAHGTAYNLVHDPFVAFDLMRAHERLPTLEVEARCHALGFVTPWVIHRAAAPCPTGEAMRRLGPHGFHGAVGPPEGAVWRVERKGKVDFLAKFLRHDKIDGCLLTNISGHPPVWNRSCAELEQLGHG